MRIRRDHLKRFPPPKPDPIGMELEILQGEEIYKCGLRKAFKIKGGRVVKCGGVRPDEAETMKFVAQRTTIPIPGSAEFVIDNGKQYLVMDYVDGQPLGNVWPSLMDAQKTIILAELKGYVDQLKVLENSYIGSLGNGPCRDRRVIEWPCGPFPSERHFNDYITANLLKSTSPERRRFLRNLLQDSHKITFTHGDLHPNNILVKDGHVVAVLDWEMSGWYPEYWEYCKALFNVQWESDWQNRICEFLEPYTYEYAVDQVLLQSSPLPW
jgi:serine/threonine protein kinase